MRTKGSRASFRGTKIGSRHDHLVRRDAPLAEGEVYHVFNRGAHKSDIFKSSKDYQRFQLLMFIANSEVPINMRELSAKYKGRTFVDVFEHENVQKNLVDVLAYSFMPNHFHMVLRQKSQTGIVRYMRRVITSYSMYFNLLHNHSGTLFQGRFRSSHVADEAYFRWIFAYVHLNPVSLCEPEWETKGIQDPEKLKNFLRGYPYSSYFDYQVGNRPESKILALTEAPHFVREQDDLTDLLHTFAKDRPL